MGFQSKTYSLSDEVVAGLKQARAAGLSPNVFLRQVFRIDQGNPELNHLIESVLAGKYPSSATDIRDNGSQKQT